MRSEEDIKRGRRIWLAFGLICALAVGVVVGRLTTNLGPACPSSTALVSVAPEVCGSYHLATPAGLALVNGSPTIFLNNRHFLAQHCAFNIATLAGGNSKNLTVSVYNTSSTAGAVFDIPAYVQNGITAPLEFFEYTIQCGPSIKPG